MVLWYSSSSSLWVVYHHRILGIKQALFIGSLLIYFFHKYLWYIIHRNTVPTYNLGGETALSRTHKEVCNFRNFK
jgi:hypothetical protein